MNIYEMFDYGPIVAMDQDWGLMVTYNASYYNLWVLQGDNKWECKECMSDGSGREDQDIWKICLKAERWLQEIIKGDEDETDE